MALDYESPPEPNFDAYAERSLALQELQHTFQDPNNPIEVAWGGRSMVALLAGVADVHAPVIIGLIHTVDPGEPAVLVSLGAFNRDSRDIPFQGLFRFSDITEGRIDQTTARNDSYIRYVLGKTIFTAAHTRDFAADIRPTLGTDRIFPNRIYEEYPGLTRYRAFHQYLEAREAGPSQDV
jgi:hypothetical protein